MGVRVEQVVRWSRFALVLSLIVFALCALVALLASPTYMGLYDTATYQARIVMFVIPPAALVWFTSGLALCYSRKSSQKSGAETHMANIMKRLSPDERDYLQQELDTRLAGVGDDGELLSVDELLDNSDQQADD
jgi:3-dehydroquinate dehydratase